MKKAMKKQTYISAISYLMFLSACNPSTEDFNADEYTLSGTGEKTPLEVSVRLQDSFYGDVQTRALNDKFENGDKLVALVEQVVRTGTEGSYSYETKISQLAEFVATSAATEVSSGNGLTTGLYWDDFSNTTDFIREDNHFLRIGYGFCFNGVEKSTASFIASKATIDWTVVNDQSDLANIRKSDLLWAGRQREIKYVHDYFGPNATAAQKEEVTLPVTYTHAMSKVTIELVLGEGYDVGTDHKAKDFGSHSTTPTLFANTTCNEVDAINQTIQTYVATGDDAKIGMYLVKDEVVTDNVSNKTRVYEAIIAPTVMTPGYKLAEVTVGGNKYDIVLTKEILETVYPASSGNATWSSKLNGYSVTSNVLKEESTGYSTADGGITLSGINYRLIATLKKQSIEVKARIANWTDVTASATGEIKFGNDVKTSEVDGAESLSNFVGSFDLWRSTTNADHNSYDENSGLAGVNKATTVTYSGGKWTNSPEIYWADGSTPYYFRALAQYFDVEETKTITSIENSFAVEQGKDIVWGTTSKHTGKEADGTTSHDYAEGAAINPRTGDIPLTFYHAMSKISVNLETFTGADAVTLAGAKISIANLYDGGTIDLTDGSIKSLTASTTLPIAGYYDADYSGADPKLKEYVVVPQSLVKTTDGIDRVGAVSFYNKAELTKIGDVYYDTSTLEKIYYSEEEILYQNGDLVGSISTNHIKKPATYFTTQDEVNEYNATLDGAMASGVTLSYSDEELTNLKNSEIAEDLFNLFDFGCTYDEFIRKDKKPFTEYSAEDVTTIKTVISGKDCKHNNVSANAYNAKLSGAKEIGAEKTPEVKYTIEEVKEHNSRLPGAIQPTDVKLYNVISTSKVANPGDLKTNEANPVIKMLIMLADGTTYSLNLADCITNVEGVEKKVEEWLRGKHYIYTITLKKEEITFRAMIKEWVESQGRGDATLDWD